MKRIPLRRDPRGKGSQAHQGRGLDSGPAIFVWARRKAAAAARREPTSEIVVVILEKQIPGLSENALTRFVLRARRAAGLRGKANVLVSSSTLLRSLNSGFRHQNKPTDVLSFPADGFKSSHGTELAGEIAISADIAVRNAARFGHSPLQEIKILTLHGILHLAGFDHERDNGEMARKEARLRRVLGLPASLIERVDADFHRTASLRGPRRTPRPRGKR